jgi:hypothetical protein
MRARRSASSSQLFSERITLSFAGMPSGKSVWSRASRSTAPSVRDLDRPERLLPVAVRVVGVVRVLRPCVPAPVRDALAEALVVRELDRREAPATPCAWRRWAPNAAARVNVRPHSGHVTSPAFSVWGFRARAIARSL